VAINKGYQMQLADKKKAYPHLSKAYPHQRLQSIFSLLFVFLKPLGVDGKELAYGTK
jgi:hypothetical protein